MSTFVTFEQLLGSIVAARHFFFTSGAVVIIRILVDVNALKENISPGIRVCSSLVWFSNHYVFLNSEPLKPTYTHSPGGVDETSVKHQASKVCLPTTLGELLVGQAFRQCCPGIFTEKRGSIDVACILSRCKVSRRLDRSVPSHL